MSHEEQSDLFQIRREKVSALREKGVNPFGHKFERTHHAKQILDQYESMSKEELQEKTFPYRLRVVLWPNGNKERLPLPISRI